MTRGRGVRKWKGYLFNASNSAKLLGVLKVGASISTWNLQEVPHMRHKVTLNKLISY